LVPVVVWGDHLYASCASITKAGQPTSIAINSATAIAIAEGSATACAVNVT
jgi:hypothetical protein